MIYFTAPVIAVLFLLAVPAIVSANCDSVSAHETVVAKTGGIFIKTYDDGPVATRLGCKGYYIVDYVIGSHTAQKDIMVHLLPETLFAQGWPNSPKACSQASSYVKTYKWVIGKAPYPPHWNLVFRGQWNSSTQKCHPVLTGQTPTAF